MKKNHVRKEIVKEGDTSIWYAEAPENPKTAEIFLYKTMVNYVRVFDPDNKELLSSQVESSEKYQELLKRLGLIVECTKKERHASKEYFYIRSIDDINNIDENNCEDDYIDSPTYEKIPIKAEIKGGKIVVKFSGNTKDVSENFVKIKNELKKERIKFTLIDNKDKLRDCTTLEETLGDDNE